jgi:hypothetical protein
MTSRALPHLALGVALATALLVGAGPDTPPSAIEVETCLSRVEDFHGGAGPWAVVGYRMGMRALKELGIPRLGHDNAGLFVTHCGPMKTQYTCMADGLHAATGASIGKLNLKLEEAPLDQLHSIVRQPASGRVLTFTPRPELVKAILDLPRERVHPEGRRIAGLPDSALFTLTETKVAPTP